ncbi:MAG: TIGR02391 family protein, partial [Promethearchaeota archaeon]
STDKIIIIDIINDYNLVVDEVQKNIKEDLGSYKVNTYNKTTYSTDKTFSYYLKDKLFQLISFLEYGYKLSEEIIEIGSIYNSIKDEELKSRCDDILTAPSNFDRVINQASQVLEDRIRTKSGLGKSFVGTNLINKALNSDSSKSVLVVSENNEEHEGFCHICRGIMLAFRNPTHHYLSDSFKREDALKFTAFIDNLLKILHKCKVVSNT